MTFASFGLKEELLKAIQDKGYTSPTAIQTQSIPLVLEGFDLLAGSQTGTGKTAGFTLPLLQILSNRSKKLRPKSVRALILSPTRELAAQIQDCIKDYSKYLSLTSAVVFGGVNINPQILTLTKGLDILVATPGRLLDLSRQNAVDLSDVEVFVLDEADRMLDMGFIHDIKRILHLLPKKRQNLFFSATFSHQIKTLASSFLREPKMIEATKSNSTAAKVEQRVHLVESVYKKELLAHLIRKNNWTQVLVFTRTKHGANRLAAKLQEDQIPASAIHGNKSQSARTKALNDFKEGKIQVLAATDIAARGLDIKELPFVVNYELPNVPEDYVHRIGRTARAGSTGIAVSLVSDDELVFLKDIEKLIKQNIEKVAVVEFTPDPSKKEIPRPPRQFKKDPPKQNSTATPFSKNNGKVGFAFRKR